MKKRDAESPHQQRRKRLQCWVVVAACVLLVLYLSAPFVIKWIGEKEFERVLRGEEPVFPVFEEWPYTDGGSVGYGGFGYVVVDVNRIGVFVSNDEPPEPTTGAELRFTCRRYFPVIQRLLKDKVVED